MMINPIRLVELKLRKRSHCLIASHRNLINLINRSRQLVKTQNQFLQLPYYLEVKLLFHHPHLHHLSPNIQTIQLLNLHLSFFIHHKIKSILIIHKTILNLANSLRGNKENVKIVFMLKIFQSTIIKTIN